MKHLFNDLRFALRLYRRTPGFTATLLGVLTLGIGATTAMFSLLYGVLLKPLPYPNSGELTVIWTEKPFDKRSSASIPDYVDLKEQGSTFQKMAAVELDNLSFVAPNGGTPLHVASLNATGEFFETFGLHALEGRLFGPMDDRVGAPHVCVISERLWREQFGSDRSLIGASVVLDGEPYTVLGVAPRGFRFATPSDDGVDLWKPFATTKRWAELKDDRGTHFLYIVGRRKPGVSVSQAHVQLAGIAADLAKAFPKTNDDMRAFVEDMHEALVGHIAKSIWVLFAGVGLVFVVVCANVAGLLLARASSRRFEFAARAALGASGARLRRQIITETLLLFGVAGVAGALVARLFIDALADEFARGAVGNLAIGIDGAALAFALALVLGCGVLASLAPAFEAQSSDPQRVLKETGSRASAGGAARLVRSALVVVQLAVACALLVGSGLAFRAFAKVANTPPGFEAEGVVAAFYGLPEGSEQKVLAFERGVIARVAQQPSVERVAYTTSLPMAGGHWSGGFRVEDRPDWGSNQEQNVERIVVSPGYFEVMRIPILRGRGFTEEDGAGSRLVTTISQETAKRIFGEEDPIGRRVRWAGKDWREIVGVVGDVRTRGLTRPAGLQTYAPAAQMSLGYASRVGAIVARSSRPRELLAALPGIVTSVDSRQAVSNRVYLGELVQNSARELRFVATLLAAFAGVALVVASLGLYGLIAYVTGQRTRELGIRLALGASPAGLVAFVMKDGLRLVLCGLFFGLVAAIAVGRIVAAQIAGAAAFDGVVTIVIASTLGLSGFLASFLPALRAARIPPATALRYE